MEKWKYEYKDGKSIVSFNYKGKTFIGEANLHPEDVTRENKRVGYGIAEKRLGLDIMRNHLHNELEPQLKALKHLQACVSQSKQHTNCYEFRMLCRSIRLLEEECAEIRELIKTLRKEYKDYLTYVNARP